MLTFWQQMSQQSPGPSGLHAVWQCSGTVQGILLRRSYSPRTALELWARLLQAGICHPSQYSNIILTGFVPSGVPACCMPCPEHSAYVFPQFHVVKISMSWPTMSDDSPHTTLNILKLQHTQMILILSYGQSWFRVRFYEGGTVFSSNSGPEQSPWALSISSMIKHCLSYFLASCLLCPWQSLIICFMPVPSCL